MTSYYYSNDPEIRRWVQEAGIDYNLEACLHYNPQPGIRVEGIEKVLAVFEGDHEGPAWHWILKLNDGQIAYLTGGCDYTGWDCQSDATSYLVETVDQALNKVFAVYDEADLPEVLGTLLKQLETGRSITWREQMDKEFGLNHSQEGGER